MLRLFAHRGLRISTMNLSMKRSSDGSDLNLRIGREDAGELVGVRFNYFEDLLPNQDAS